MANLISEAHIETDKVLFEDAHVLFVEGASDNSFDTNVLKLLFEKRISVKPLGSSFHIESVAYALNEHHPTYYFLIDRDFHRDDDFVNRCWDTFPDQNTNNLIVWKKKEIENYFLDPHYLHSSNYCTVNQDELADIILNFSRQRLYLDVANYVVIGIREELKRNWIEKYTDLSKFQSKDAALNELKNSPEIQSRTSEVSDKVSFSEIEQRFNVCLTKMTNGMDEITFGSGAWSSMQSGKQIFTQIVSSPCFDVSTNDGQKLTGKDRIHPVIRDLLIKDESILPVDFVELKQKILKLVG